MLLILLIGKSCDEAEINDAYVNVFEAVARSVFWWQLVVVPDEQVVELQVVVDEAGVMYLLQNIQKLNAQAINTTLWQFSALLIEEFLQI